MLVDYFRQASFCVSRRMASLVGDCWLFTMFIVHAKYVFIQYYTRKGVVRLKFCDGLRVSIFFLSSVSSKCVC